MWWVRRIMVEEKATVVEYWAHPDCNTNGELGSFVAAKELGQDIGRFRSFLYRMVPGKFQTLSFLE
jgi:hypothetical protein